MIRELILSANRHETRAALMEDGVPAEIFIERESRAPLLGNIYLGRVTSVLPGMQSAFVDLGTDRDAFLYVTDLIPPDSASPEMRPRAARDRGPAIETFVRPDQKLLVQVVREPLGTKGARATTHLSLPGRALVLLPHGSGRSVSRRVGSEEEKQRLQRLAEEIPGEEGFIVRTAAEGCPPEALRREADTLRRRWKAIEARAGEASAPACLHLEAELSVRLLRDLLTESIHRVVVDGEAALDRCREYAAEFLPLLAHRLERYQGPADAFEALGIDREIRRALRRRVALPSGGTLIIHPTEALVAIDVNTARFIGSSGFEQTALETNCEAVREIVRQIRLRDLGGILVVDFIDMQEEANRERVTRELEEALKADRARSRMLGVSEFGLVQITRQRIRRGLDGVLRTSCPTCRGAGRLRTAETLRLQLQRELRRSGLIEAGTSWRVLAHPDLIAEIRAHWEDFLEEARLPSGTQLRLETVPGVHPEHYEVRGD
ncbi:MAG TPA: Rne/Rng family ribonuclease [Candidatus Polarisedimenticolia bacterium]|nr:Rne/Rng family ribonuclease [Candidatus Polarisedimenticolia bacterium]